MKKVGLILEGGANRGIFTSGVLDCLMKQELYLPYVVSVSMGACNALDYISRQIGRTKNCIIPDGQSVPPIHWKHLKNKKSFIDMDMVFDEYPNKKIPFDYDVYFQSKIKSEYVVTNCLSGKAEYWTEKSDKKRLMDICRASCSMPYLSPMMELDGIPYLDGGISDAIPIRRAIQSGYDRNIVVLTRQKGYVKKESDMANAMSRKMYAEYPNLMRRLKTRVDRYNKTVRYLEYLEKKKEVLLIRPEKVLVSRTDNNVNRLTAFYRQGYRITMEKLQQIRAFIAG